VFRKEGGRCPSALPATRKNAAYAKAGTLEACGGFSCYSWHRVMLIELASDHERYRAAGILRPPWGSLNRPAAASWMMTSIPLRRALKGNIRGVGFQIRSSSGQ